MMTPRRSLLLVAALGLSLPAPAFAHHAVGGETPLTFLQGFISGLVHPVIGPDHLFFLLTAGVLAHWLKSPLLYATSVVFVLSGLAGTGLHLAGFDMSSAEVVIALSVIVSGAMVLSRRHPGVVALSLFFALAGVFHGYAYAESIVGAQSGPLVAYLAGLALIQVAIITAVAAALRKLNAWERGSLAAHAESFAGGAALVVGAVWLALNFV